MMNNQQNRMQQKKTFAKIFLTAGILAITLGVFLEIRHITAGFDPRLVTSGGILLLGVGFSTWLRYRKTSQDTPEARQIINAESDERALFIRNRAGHRGFWAAIALTYSLLMWESIASNGSLPMLSGDARWLWLAAAVVIPFVIYISSIVYDQSHY